MKYSIAVIPGDGIGTEVIGAGIRVMRMLEKRFDFELELEEFPFSCTYYKQHGEMMPANGISLLRRFQAILLGAVGDPSVPDHVSLWGLLLPIRRQFDQYANVRPVRLLAGVSSPLKDKGADDIDMVVVRENTEGEYSDIGGRLFSGTEREIVVQESVFSKTGVDRIIRYACELAVKRKNRQLTAATKSNGIRYTMPFWDERFAAVTAEYPELRCDKYHIDILTAHFVLHPEWFDVVVGSNLFGDILSDLGPAIAGGIGIAPSANLNVEGISPSLFEPVHGSAPDIAGKGLANPIATFWSIQMMLEFLGEEQAGQALMAAVERVTAQGLTTPDLGGSETTASFTDKVIRELG